MAKGVKGNGRVHPAAGGICAGLPAAGTEWRIVPIRRNLPAARAEGLPPLPDPLPNGEIGELTVTGAHVCKGYHNNPAADRENKFRGPDGRIWHRMGDTGCLDRHGRFWLAGRVHSTIIRGERRDHPLLVEEAVRTLVPDLAEVAAVGLPRPDGRTELALVIRHAKGKIPDLESRLAHLGFSIDRIVYLSKALPKDPRHNAKIDYPKLIRTIRKRRK